MTPGGSVRETMTAALSDLEHRLIYDVAQLKGEPVGRVAVRYGAWFDIETDRLYCHVQDTES